MAKGVSIAMSVKDNFSTSVSTMRNSMKRFDKDAEETAKTLEKLYQEQERNATIIAKAQTKMDGASVTLKKMREEYKRSSDDLNRTNLEKAYTEYNRLQNEIKEAGQAARETQKKIRDLQDQESKADNRAMGAKESLKALSTAGIFKMAGDSISGAVNKGISSAFGTEQGAMISSALSGALSGAAMGSIAGTIGTAIGGAVGLASGIIEGGTQAFENRDSAFKSYYQDQYQRLMENRKSMLEMCIRDRSARTW